MTAAIITTTFKYTAHLRCIAVPACQCCRYPEYIAPLLQVEFQLDIVLMFVLIFEK